MTRLIVIALLAGNLLLAAFQASRATPEDHSVQPIVRPDMSNVPSIRLLSELESGADAVTPERQCFTVGPFETGASKDVVRVSLLEHTDVIHERTTQALMELGYWVALPAFETFAEAGEAARELRKSGLEDLAVVNGEAGDYLVSAGYFLDESNALGRRDQVRELGYSAVTRLQREAQPRYWLDYELATGAPLASPMLADSIPVGMHRAVPCAKNMAGDATLNDDGLPGNT